MATSKARFLQLHFLTSYPASLLNRDDVGFAKRVPFGAVTRTRVSSQCLKRHWRKHDGLHSLQSLSESFTEAQMTIRSRLTFERELHDKLIADQVSPELAKAFTLGLMETFLGKSEKKKLEEAAEKEPPKKGKKGKKDSEAEVTATAEEPAEQVASKKSPLHTGQVTVLGARELGWMLAEVRKLVPQAKSAADAMKLVGTHFKGDVLKNLQALKLGAGLDAALFGRMITSDILARCDAAVHVAHAFTVHGEQTESDYFSAVDDLLQNDGELGSGHIGNTELTSGLFYGYVVVDLPLLVSNLEGVGQSAFASTPSALGAGVLESLVHSVATVSPGAKKGSTAPYSFAHFVSAELGDEQPRTLANAFLEPVQAKGQILRATYGQLKNYTQELDAAYGKPPHRCHLALGGSALEDLGGVFGERKSLSELARWVAASSGITEGGR